MERAVSVPSVKSVVKKLGAVIGESANATGDWYESLLWAFRVSWSPAQSLIFFGQTFVVHGVRPRIYLESSMLDTGDTHCAKHSATADRIQRLLHEVSFASFLTSSNSCPRNSP